MKIIELRAANIKKLVAVEIAPTGNLVEITGKNGAGKSSVLDSLWWALTGADNVQSNPIRSGQQKAQITLRLAGEQNLVVTRKFARKDEGGFTTSLQVETTDGAKFSSPQSMLDALLGQLSFDPLAFARMKPADQFNALKRFVPGYDFDAAERENKVDFDRRTLVNRQAKEAKAAADAIGVQPGTPAELVDESQLAADLEEAGRFNVEIEARKQRRERVQQEASAERNSANDMRARAAAMRLEADKIDALSHDADEKAADLEHKLKEAGPLPDAVDTAAIRSRMDTARVTNANVRRIEEREAHRAKADDLEKQADEISNRMDARKVAAREAIAAAKMPVPGIDFGDGIVLLNGQPFDQASDAEQLRTSVAIAMAANPKLRVIRIRDGSLLDSSSMQVLADMATEHDFQVWIETVDSSGKMAFVLEDGRLKAHQAEAAA